MPTDNSGQQDQQAQQTNDQQTQQTQQTSTQTQNGEPQGQQQTQTRQTDDRGNWIPPHRFNEVNTRYQTEKTQREQLAAQLADANRRIQALAGVQQVSPQELEVSEIRQALSQVIPGIDKLSPEMIERLVSIAQNGEQLEDTNRTIWRNHGTKMIRSAQDRIAEKLNVDGLTDRQKKRIGREYVTFIEENAANGSMDRHEAGDEALIDDFVKAFLEDWQESIRKSVVTSETSRSLRPVPSGRGRSVVVGQRKPKANLSNDKEFADAAVQSFLDNGGQFGG